MLKKYNEIKTEMEVEYNCKECGWKGYLPMTDIVECPNCGNINDVWLESEDEPKRHVSLYKKYLSESLLNYLKGPSEDDIIKDILKKKPIKKYGLFKNKDNINNLLIKSCKSGSMKGVKLAIENGADIFCCDGSPINSAIGYNNMDIIKYLHELDNRVINDQNLSYLLLGSIFYSDDITTLKYLMENPGTKFMLITINKKELIKSTVVHNRLNALKYLISLGYNYHFDDEILIRIAADSNYYEIVDYLLSLGGFELYIDKYIYDIAKQRNYKELMEIAKKYHLDEW